MAGILNEMRKSTFEMGTLVRTIWPRQGQSDHNAAQFNQAVTDMIEGPAADEASDSGSNQWLLSLHYFIIFISPQIEVPWAQWAHPLWVVCQLFRAEKREQQSDWKNRFWPLTPRINPVIVVNHGIYLYLSSDFCSKSYIFTFWIFIWPPILPLTGQKHP